MTTKESIEKQILKLEENTVFIRGNARVGEIRQYLQGLSGKELSPNNDRCAITDRIKKFCQERAQLEEEIIEPTKMEIRRLRRIYKEDEDVTAYYIDARILKARNTIRKFSHLSLPERVLPIMEICPNIVSTSRVTKYLNPNTQWNNKPRLYFGMGAGSQQLTKAFPMGVLNMLFASEFLRREFALSRCTIVCGDIMTKTNPFPPADIDRIVMAERDMIQFIVNLFGFDNWNIILMSDLHAINDGGVVWKNNIFLVDPEKCRHPEYIIGLQWWYRYINNGIKASPYKCLGFDSRGHEDNWHFAMESAVTHYTVSNGIHYGWYIPGPDIPDAETMERIIEKHGKPKVMDEQPFDEFYIWTHRIIKQAGGPTEPDRITPIYSMADVRLPKSNEIERVPPYIAYYPERRILMCDGPDQIRQKVAGIYGEWKFSKKHPITHYWTDLIVLAEVLGIDCGRGNLIDRLCAFSERIHVGGVLKNLYSNAFPNLGR